MALSDKCIGDPRPCRDDRHHHFNESIITDRLKLGPDVHEFGACITLLPRRWVIGTVIAALAPTTSWG
jgi:hypothetical protein